MSKTKPHPTRPPEPEVPRYVICHSQASVRTPFSQWPRERPVCFYGDGPEGFHESIYDLLEGVIDHHYLVSDSEERLGEDWAPALYLFGTQPIRPAFDPLEWVGHIRDSLRDNPRYSPEDCAWQILEDLEEDAYDGWDGKPYVKPLTQLLVPVFQYLQYYKDFFNLWEAVRLILPLQAVVEDLDLGFTEDESHAIDVSPEDLLEALDEYYKGR